MRSHFPGSILYFLQVLVAMSHPVNRPCSPYLASMATLRLRWSSSQVTTVTLFSTRVQASVHPLVTDTTCTCTTTTLQATAVPTPTVVPPNPSPLGTLHLVLSVDFMQDPANSLPLMWETHLQFCKRYLEVNNKASNIACRAELGRFPLNITINKKFLKYITV